MLKGFSQAAGADVALLARRIEKLNEVKAEIEKTGRKVAAVGCDITNEESVKAAMQTVLDTFGHIVILLNNAGVADKFDAFIRHSYNSSKAAVVGLTRGMAASYAKYGITVNAIGPALFESEMTSETLFKSEKFLNQYNTLNPAGRPGRKGELNGTVLYLSSDSSSYVQGQFIIVDGGGALV